VASREARQSNAIVYAGRQTVGSVPDTSRVDSAQIGIPRLGSHPRLCPLRRLFSVSDGVDVAARAGIRAVIQPGGSVKDQEVIEAANEHGMAMVFTGVRHFKH
jgi:phosphoribosylaminoimidazolecarboxamide formyltransferase/IMP cyclohydrolase